jgi:hypothetical protein
VAWSGFRQSSVVSSRPPAGNASLATAICRGLCESVCNPASGRVIQKIGMGYERSRAEHYKKWGAYEDSVEYGLLARDWRGFHRG